MVKLRIVPFKNCYFSSYVDHIGFCRCMEFGNTTKVIPFGRNRRALVMNKQASVRCEIRMESKAYQSPFIKIWVEWNHNAGDIKKGSWQHRSVIHDKNFSYLVKNKQAAGSVRCFFHAQWGNQS